MNRSFKHISYILVLAVLIPFQVQAINFGSLTTALCLAVSNISKIASPLFKTYRLQGFFIGTNSKITAAVTMGVCAIPLIVSTYKFLKNKNKKTDKPAQVTHQEVTREEVPQPEVTRQEVTQEKITQEEVTQPQLTHVPEDSKTNHPLFNFKNFTEQTKQHRQQPTKTINPFDFNTSTPLNPAGSIAAEQQDLSTSSPFFSEFSSAESAS